MHNRYKGEQEHINNFDAFFLQIWVPLSKLTELYYYSNSSIYERMPSAYFWEREEWSVISVFILSENLDIFQ